MIDLPWQGSSPAPEMGDSSYGYESQRSEASNTSFYNDVPQEYHNSQFVELILPTNFWDNRINSTPVYLVSEFYYGSRF